MDGQGRLVHLHIVVPSQPRPGPLPPLVPPQTSALAPQQQPRPGLASILWGNGGGGVRLLEAGELRSAPHLRSEGCKNDRLPFPHFTALPQIIKYLRKHRPEERGGALSGFNVNK